MENAKIIIREAINDDFEWAANLMHNALEPYYGGDHYAHAKRIFDAHIKGGHDNIGFFSFEQRMFIAEVDGRRAGLIHLVGKRQSTYKISPLIVASEFRGAFGLGVALLDYAENYSRANKARQLYCTVAEKNIAAMQFFLRKGFIKAGSSDSHYKNGVTEMMLYKPLYADGAIALFDKPHISVVPLEENNAELKKQVTELLLEKLPMSFEGIDVEWVEALFSGYSRRQSADINAKYKLIYVAIDDDKKVVGIAAGTPKKGNPIKMMPFIATSMVAFEALLIDIPYQLAPYGRKLYIHINPNADEVIALQRLGWKLDAALPSAYRPGVITQQWSIAVGATTMRTMRVKKRFFDLVVSGIKDLEVRVGYDTINRIQLGERVNLATHMESCIVQVKRIRRYDDFESALRNERYDRIAPDASSCEEVLVLLRDIYPPEKEMLGVVVLEISTAIR